MSEQKNGIGEFIQIPLEWGSDDDLDTIYVNQLRITHGGPEFYIHFGELPFPAKLPGEAFPDKLIINPKVRLVVTGEQLGEFLETLNSNYENYLNKKKVE